MKVSVNRKIKVFCLIALMFSQVIFLKAQPNIESLKFRETDIRTVIRSIAAQAYRDGRQVNIVAGPEITGLVNIELRDVNWQEALRVVLRAYNYGYEWVSDHMILVTTLEEMTRRRQEEAASRDIEATVAELFRFNFAKVEDLQNTVKDLVSSRGRVTIDARTNTLIILDTPTSLEGIRQDIRSLDSTSPQVLIEAKIIETSFDASERIGIDWEVALKASGSKRPHVWPFGDTLKDKHFTESFPFAGAATVSPEVPFTFGTMDASSLSAALELVLSDSETKILSQPKIMTMDNSPASIRVVTDDPIPRYSYSTETGMWEITGFEYKSYGVFLDVVPQINQAGFITLDVEPTVSDRAADRQFSTSGQTVNIPMIETRTASTKVMIRDGETLVIGGLIKDKKIESIKKVPLLGSLPLLGKLFQHKGTSERKVNLLVFITPRIMTPELTEASSEKIQQ